VLCAAKAEQREEPLSAGRRVGEADPFDVTGFTAVTDFSSANIAMWSIHLAGPNGANGCPAFATVTRNRRCWSAASFTGSGSDTGCMTGVCLALPTLYFDHDERPFSCTVASGTGTPIRPANSLECQNLNWTFGNPNWKVTESGICDISPNWRHLVGST